MNNKVAFCINNLKVGGAEKLLIDLINNWPGRFEIYLILLQEKDNLSDLLDASRNIKKITLWNTSSTCYQIKEIRRLFVTNKIDFCFSHLERSNKICLMASLMTKTRVFPVIHNINIYEESPLCVKYTASIIYQILSRVVVAISEPVRNYCIDTLKINGKKIIQINNGIDFKRIEQYERDLSFDDKVSFAVLGRMEYVKGYDILLQALGSDKLRNLNWQLKMIGDGSELQKLRTLAGKIDIHEKIVFLGTQKFPFIHLTDVHFLVMPSRREGLPISLLEALSFGIPVIGSKVGVLPDIINNGRNGYIFESENVNMLVDVILKCIKISPQQYYLMETDAKLSIEKYSIGNCVGKYLEVINRM